MPGTVTLKLSTNIITNNITSGEDYSFEIKNETEVKTVILMEVVKLVSGLENDVQYNVSVSISDS